MNYVHDNIQIAWPIPWKMHSLLAWKILTHSTKIRACQYFMISLKNIENKRMFQWKICRTKKSIILTLLNWKGEIKITPQMQPTAGVVASSNVFFLENVVK